MTSEKLPPYHQEIQKFLSNEEKKGKPVNSGRANTILDLLRKESQIQLTRTESAQIFHYLTYKSEPTTHCSGKKVDAFNSPYKKIAQKQRFSGHRLKETAVMTAERMRRERDLGKE